MTTLPTQARAVVIGGGIVGCSVAYHLAKQGWKDVVLIERKRITSGTTWHAAGLVGQLRGSSTLTKIARYSAAQIQELEAETGVVTGFRQNGSLSLALSSERMEELKRQATMGKVFGVDAHLVTPEECRKHHPLVDLKGVVGGLFIPVNGQVDPANLCQAYAKAARLRGVRVFENCPVTEITKSGGRVTGVTTPVGAIRADYVVNCAGLWGRAVGRMAGVAIPLMACEHFYVVTEPSTDIPRNLPVLRVPDEQAYIKEEAGKLLIGFFERDGRPLADARIPADAEFLTLPDEWEHLSDELATASRRLPILERIGMHSFFNGPESFTPDGKWILGEAPDLRNFFIAAGFNSIGIQTAGGAGKAMAEWMEAGGPTMDLTGNDIRRCQPYQSNATYLLARTGEALGLHYADQFPYRQPETARGVRHLPLHERHVAAGATFGDSSGWERPLWYAAAGTSARDKTEEPRWSWFRQNFFQRVAAEHRAVRTGVALLDLSAFGKIRVEGRDAEALLQRICANDVAVDLGRIVYTPWLNATGGIEADLTVNRLSRTEFLVVTSSAAVPRDLAWLRRHTPDDAHCVAMDVTNGEACLAIMGPKARALLAPLVDVALDNQSFPFGTFKIVEIGMGLARAHRVSYVGELGWELYVPVEMARHVFDTIVAAGQQLGLVLAGSHALDTCRLEKAYRHYGHDIAATDHVLEAGLGFAVRTEKSSGRFGQFIGRDAVLARRDAGLSSRLVQFLLKDPEPLLYGNEAIVRDGVVVGYLTSGGYGHHLGAAVGLGYVKHAPGESAQSLLASRYEIEVATVRIPAEASLSPFYDPTSSRVKA